VKKKGWLLLAWATAACCLESSSIVIPDGTLPANRRYAIERELLVATIRVFHDGGDWCAARVEWLAPGEAIRPGDFAGPHP